MALHRQALAEAGEKIAAAQAQVEEEITRVGLQIAGAVSAGMNITEISELTGLRRQKIYELRNRYRGHPDDLNMQVLGQLGASGALTVDQVAGHLRLDVSQVKEAVKALLADDAVKPLLSAYQGGSEETYFKLTARGEGQLEEWLLSPGREPARMSVYVSIGEDEKEALRDVAIDVFGVEWFAVIEADTVHGLSNPELAFNVVAESPEEAALRARNRMEELRRLAKLKQRPTVVSAMFPAGPLHLNPGRRSGGVDVFAEE